MVRDSIARSHRDCKRVCTGIICNNSSIVQPSWAPVQNSSSSPAPTRGALKRHQVEPLEPSIGLHGLARHIPLSFGRSRHASFMKFDYYLVRGGGRQSTD